MKKSWVILLSATVNPSGMSYTVLQDPLVRQQHYLNSLRKWIKNTNSPIVFIENSNCDLNFFRERLPSKSFDRIEMLTFEGNNFKPDLGKGYGEMKIIQYGMQNSHLLQNSEFVFKITGRYHIKNFRNCIKNIKDDADLYINFTKGLSFADSRFFGCTTLFLSEYLFKYSEKLNDSKNYFFEHALAQASLNAIADGYHFSPYSNYPLIDGIYGTEGIKYNTSFLFWLPREIKMKIKHYLLAK